MNSTRNQARFAGLLYILVSIPGVFSLIYVPTKLVVQGNAALTADNIASSETLFRLGIGFGIISQILFIWVAVCLYDLFKGINRRHAAVMLGLIVVPLPIVLINELNAMAALILVRGGDFLSVVDKPQRDALAMFFLSLHDRGFDVAGIFWGLWLFPLGLLVYRSRILSRFIGVLLMANCFTFLATSFTSLMMPQYEAIVSRWVKPFGFGELIFMFWMLIMGAKPNPIAAPPSLASAG